MIIVLALLFNGVAFFNEVPDVKVADDTTVATSNGTKKPLT